MSLEDELKKLYEQELRDNEVKKKELADLVEILARKMADAYLQKEKHTQLSYLSKEEQEHNLSIPRGVILDKLISVMRQIR